MSVEDKVDFQSIENLITRSLLIPSADDLYERDDLRYILAAAKKRFLEEVNVRIQQSLNGISLYWLLASHIKMDRVEDVCIRLHVTVDLRNMEYTIHLNSYFTDTAMINKSPEDDTPIGWSGIDVGEDYVKFPYVYMKLVGDAVGNVDWPETAITAVFRNDTTKPDISARASSSLKEFKFVGVLQP